MTTQVSAGAPAIRVEGVPARSSRPLRGLPAAGARAAGRPTVAQVSGISQAGVNFTTGKARVSFDPVPVTVADRAAAVSRAGYSVGPTLVAAPLATTRQLDNNNEFFLGGVP